MNSAKEGWIFILERNTLGRILHNALTSPLRNEFPHIQIIPPESIFSLLDIDRSQPIEESTLQNGLIRYLIYSSFSLPAVAITHVNRPESLAAVQNLHEMGVLMTVRLPNPDVTIPEVSIGESTEFFQNAGIPYFLDGHYPTWAIAHTLQLLRES